MQAWTSKPAVTLEVNIFVEFNLSPSSLGIIGEPELLKLDSKKNCFYLLLSIQTKRKKTCGTLGSFLFFWLLLHVFKQLGREDLNLFQPTDYETYLTLFSLCCLIGICLCLVSQVLLLQALKLTFKRKINSNSVYRKEMFNTKCNAVPMLCSYIVNWHISQNVSNIFTI